LSEFTKQWFPVLEDCSHNICSHHRPAPDSEQEEWMSDLDDDLSITWITMPGTHDSACMSEEGGKIAKCQSWSIKDQLKTGIRFLDVRCKVEGNELKLYHGVINCRISFLDLLEDCGIFLQDHPSEFLILRVKEEDKSHQSCFNHVYRQEINQIESRFNNIMLRRHSRNRMPKLREARGKIIILKNFQGRGYGGEFSWRSAYMQDIFEPDSISDKKQLIQRHHENITQNHIFKLNFFSACRIFVGFPIDFAQQCNEVVNQLRDKFGGIMVMDFPGENAIRQIIRFNQSRS
jgi:1-phosphatidylinositol phosphodiesterase